MSNASNNKPSDKSLPPPAESEAMAQRSNYTLAEPILKRLREALKEGRRDIDYWFHEVKALRAAAAILKQEGEWVLTWEGHTATIKPAKQP